MLKHKGGRKPTTPHNKEDITMATTKSARLNHLDHALKNLQDIADKIGYHIDSDPIISS